MSNYIRLTYERNKRRWSQEKVGQLMQLLGGHHRALTIFEISNIERGRLIPNAEELAALGRVFKISPATVLLKPVKVVDPEPEEEPEVSA